MSRYYLLLHGRLVSIASLVALTLMLTQLPIVYANHERINPELRPSESGNAHTYFVGEKVSVVLNMAVGSDPVGHAAIGNSSETYYQAEYRLQLIDPPDQFVRSYSQGFAGLPETEKPYPFEIPVPLTLGKWRISVNVYETDSHEPVLQETWVDDIDVVARSVQDPFALATPIATIIGAAAAVGIPLYLHYRPKKEKKTGDPPTGRVQINNISHKEIILQQIIDLIENIPKENTTNLEYHYCKLKNNRRVVDFSYHPKPALRNQADKVETTLDRVAGIVFDNAEVYDDFFRLYSEYFLLAWVLCKEDIEAKRSVNPSSGKKFEELAQKMSNGVRSIPKPDCAKVTEWMPPPDAEIDKAARDIMKRIGKEKVSILLQEAKLLAIDTRDQKMMDWIEIELAGYYPDADKMSPEENRRTAHNIPDYRLVKGFFHFRIADGSIHDLPYSVKMGNSIKMFENLVDQLLPTGGNGYIPYTFPADTPIVAGQTGKMEVNVSQFQKVVSGVEAELSRRLQEKIS